MAEIVEFLKKEKIGKYLENISLKNYNSFKLNTTAKLMVFPKDEGSLLKLLSFLKTNKYKYLVLGNGSNVIFKNDYYDGVIIKLDSFNKLEIKNDIVVSGAGISLPNLALKTIKMGLSGLEFAVGIPGLVGSSAAMNAGAYNSDMASVIKSVKVINSNLEIETLENKDLDFSYRDSFLKKNKDYICLEVTLKLNKGDKEELLEIVKKRRLKRQETQPLNYPSAGSVFRNPEGLFAGKLIEDAKLKGFEINGACVSEKHANFIINKGKAKGEDIVKLIETIKKEVFKQFKINLKLEQEIIE